MQGSWQRSYELASNPPPAMAWSEYAERADSEYQGLLATDPSEPELQTFFERNPAFLPGARTPGAPSGHAPFPGAVISQPELHGIGANRPDFMWIAHHTGMWYPTLIEIERPRKRIFQDSPKSRTTPRAEFTQARNQLDEWRTWFQNPTNVELFAKVYQIPDEYLRHDQMRLHLILVYGRREECGDDPKRSRHLSSLIQDSGDVDRMLLSFDSKRLRLDPELDYVITVKLQANERYKAICVPPTFRLGPCLADWLLLIDGIEDAADSDSRITPARKQFIRDRLPYWRKHAQSEGPRGIGSNCWE